MKELILRVKLRKLCKGDTDEDQKEGIKELIHTMKECYQVIDYVNIVEETQVHVEVIRNKETLSALNINEPVLLLQTERVEFIEPGSKITLDRIERILQEMVTLEKKRTSVAGMHMLK
jgi:hypothetical protein